MRENGEIASRAEIKKVHVSVPKLSEQAAVVSSVSQMPRISWIIQGTESYPAVKDLFEQLDITDLDDSAKVKALNLKGNELGLGQETLKDIIADLLKPGRDLRDDFEAPD